LKFTIGIDKFPLIKFDTNKYTHIFHVTKYQFERYIWETAPNIDYDKIIAENPRIPPDEISSKNLKSLFMTNVTLREASEFATG